MRIWFGEHVLHLETGELMKVHLEAQLPMQLHLILHTLLEYAPRLVSRETLLELLYQGEARADADHNLNQAVTRLRMILNDVKRSEDMPVKPKYIETVVGGRGFRWCGPTPEITYPSAQVCPIEARNKTPIPLESEQTNGLKSTPK